MKKWYSALTALLAFLGSFQAMGQAARLCSEGHIRSAARVAITTAAQQRLMNKYDVNFYKLDIELERNSTYVQGNGLIQATSKVAALDTFAFELHQNLAIDSLILNGQNRPFTRQGGFVYGIFASPVPNNGTVAARIYYKGTPPAGGSAAAGQGLNTAPVPAWGSNVTWSISQPFAAYFWFPVKQLLTDKADSTEVWITTSATNKAGSNGILKNTTTLPSGKKRYEWKSRYPIAYYLISVAVSDYQEYTISANPAGAPQPIPILNYVYGNPAALPNYQTDIDATAPMMVTFSDLFGLYPFYQEKYGHSMAPFFGGMEHQTMTTQGIFDFWLTAHELGHQWFGNNVTCGSWRDIWLNEGFASYTEYLAFEHLRPTQARSTMDYFHSGALSQNGGSLYVPAADSLNPARIFSSNLSYYKGAAVVHMLRFAINNDSLFFAALKTYQNQFALSTAKTPNFKQVAETVTGKNLTAFFNQWVYGEGAPTFMVNWNQVGQDLILRVNQLASMPTVTPFFETDVEYKILTDQGDVLVRVAQTNQVNFYVFPVTGNVTGLQVDPDQWILNRPGQVRRDQFLTTAGPAEKDGASLVLYPNPAGEWLQITGLPFAPETIRVLDATGRVVKTEKPNRLTGQKLQIGDLPAGLYLLQLEGKGQALSRTFRKF